MNKKFWIGIFISLIFLFLFLKELNYKELSQAFLSANYYYLIPAVFFLWISFLLRAWRWQIFLKEKHQISVPRLLSPLFIGFMGNCVLPLRLGEVIRCFMLSRQEKVPFTLGVATLVVERIFDAICLLSMLVYIILFLPVNLHVEGGNSYFTPGLIQKSGLSLMALTIFILLFLIVLYIKTDLIKQIIGRFTKNTPQLTQNINHLIDKFADGLHVLKSTQDLVLVILQSFLVWFAIAVSIYFVMLAFHLSNMPLFAPIFIMGITAIGVSVPSAPGYIGTYHVACEYSLRVLGGNLGIAKSFAIVLHLTQMVPVIICGFYYLWKNKIKLTEIRHVEIPDSKP